MSSWRTTAGSSKVSSNATSSRGSSTDAASKPPARRCLPSPTVKGPRVQVIFFDLDDFKGINDQFGHLAGDLALKRTGAAIAGAVRDVDVAAARRRRVRHPAVRHLRRRHPPRRGSHRQGPRRARPRRPRPHAQRRLRERGRAVRPSPSTSCWTLPTIACTNRRCSTAWPHTDRQAAPPIERCRPGRGTKHPTGAPKTPALWDATHGAGGGGGVIGRLGRWVPT